MDGGPNPGIRAAAAAGTGPDALAATTAALEEVAATMAGASVGLAVVFVGSGYVEAADEVRRRVAERLAPAVLVGVTAQGVLAGATEIEAGDSVSIWAASLPAGSVTPLRLPPAEAGSMDWPPLPDDATALVVLADPFTFPADTFLAWVDRRHPGLPVIGGLASGAVQPGGNRLFLDGEVHRDGAVALAFGGDVRLTTLVSQGCRPVGPAWVVTDAEANVIRTLAGQPALQRLNEVYADADPVDQVRMQTGLHIGLVIDEYADEHDVGGFLIRGVMGADRDTGAVAIGDRPEVGQTVRFQVRDADSADEDLRRLLHDSVEPAPAAALLFTCNGRGSRLFGTSHHDAELVHDTLDGVPLAGFFAAGELGPVGGRNHLHGFTASLLTLAPGATD